MTRNIADNISDIRTQLERDILSYLAYSPKLESKLAIVEQLEATDFAYPLNRIIYTAIVRCLVKHRITDIVVISEQLKETKDFQPALDELLKLDARTADHEAELKTTMLRDYSKIARISELAKDLQTREDITSASEMLRSLETFVFDEYRKERGGKMSMGDAIKELLHRNSLDIKPGYDWLDTLSELTDATGGIERGKTYIIGGSKKSGKTRFVCSVMRNLIQQGIKPLFLSMEMKELEVAKLMLAACTKISTAEFNRKLDPENKLIMEGVADFLEENLLLDTEGGLTVEKVRAKVWRAMNNGTTVCVMDYIQRMHHPDTKNKNYATIVSDTLAQLADIGRDYNVAMILLSQLRNEAEGDDVLDMRFLKDSGGIAEAADAIITITNKQRQMKGEAKFSCGGNGEVDFWLSVEQRSGETKLIKCQAQLGKLHFYIPTNLTPPILTEKQINRQERIF
jgi:replicative DNA helicase